MKQRKKIRAPIHVPSMKSVLTVCVLSAVFLSIGYSVTADSAARLYPTHPYSRVVTAPFSLSSYLRAATAIDQQFVDPDAKYVLSLATDRFGQFPTVLGAAIEYGSPELRSWYEQKQADETAYTQWNSLIASYPLFADVYFKTAYYAIRLGKYEEARTLLQKTTSFAPMLNTGKTLFSKIPKQ